MVASRGNGTRQKIRPIRLAIVLPGLGRVRRGAETAFHELAIRLSGNPDFKVSTFGLGHERMEGLEHIEIGGPGRDWFERWPTLPALRNAMAWEELFFVSKMRLTRRFRLSDFDLVMGCSYPWINWSLQNQFFGVRPKFVHVTQNGDWPVSSGHREYRFFKCDGLVCVSPEHFERCHGRFSSVLIGNGVDTSKFHPSQAQEDELYDSRFDALPGHIGGVALPPKNDLMRIVLVSSALTAEKHVDAAIRAVAGIENAFLAIAGDGPLRDEHLELAQKLIPNRFAMLGSVPTELMPPLYRRAAAFLHMNASEPFGIVYLEAAASGLPIIAPDVPTARWILGDSAFYFANADDPELVANRLAQALKPSTGTIQGVDGRQRIVNDWSWDQKASEYAGFLTQLHFQTNRP